MESRDEKIVAGREADLPVGGTRVVETGEGAIAVFRTEEGIFALDDACPHRGGPLSEGDVVDGEVICPWHFWAFDLGTGCHGPSGGRFSVRTWVATIEDGMICLRSSEENDESKAIEARRSAE